MELKVNYEELKDLGKYVDTKHDEINKKLEEILKLLDEVEENWEGNDATVFLAKSKYYVEKEIIDNEKVKDVSTVLGKVSGKYEGNDVAFDNQMKKESAMYEKRG